MKTLFFIPLFLLLSLPATQTAAQTAREPEEKIISDLMERWIENIESTIDYTDLQEQLEYFMKHKIDLNKADRFKLEQLVLLNDVTINAILKHRADFGDFGSIYELQTIEAMDERTLYYLSYFVKTGDDFYRDKTPFLQRIQKGKHELIALRDNDFEQRAGYDKGLKDEGRSYYQGSPTRYVLRYRFNYNNKLSFGYTGEKDMGEPFLSNNKGFDFNSVHFMMRDMGKLRALAIGDYQANFGQGLTFGSGIAARKSAYVLNVRRGFEPIRAYRSLNENEFMRGVATTIAIAKLTFTAFGSYKPISTNYQAGADRLSNEDAEFSSIQLSGLHRTQTELSYKNNVRQTIVGGHVSYKKETYEIGTTVVHAQYDKTFSRGTDAYQLYQFNGNKLYTIGVDYGIQIGNANLFGECSRSNNGGLAGVAGLNTALHQNLDMVLVYRNYGKNFQTVFNNPFGENSDGRNEEGFYTGVSFKPLRRWQLNIYLDLYRSKWLRYLVDAPSHGTDYLAELQYNPTKSSQFYIRFRSETKHKNQPDNISETDYTALNQRKQYRINAQYTITEKLSGKSRLEIIAYRDELSGKQQGSLIFQDLHYTTTRKRFSFVTRLAIFSVDDYNARVYATEQDVLYQYSVPLYQNSGIRYYGVFHFRANKKLDMWLKYSQTQYSNINSISSGLEKITGNKVSDLRLQLRITL